jgi:hypothetical protein
VNLRVPRRLKLLAPRSQSIGVSGRDVIIPVLSLTEESHETLSQHSSRYPGRDSNRAPPSYKLPLRQPARNGGLRTLSVDQSAS